MRSLWQVFSNLVSPPQAKKKFGENTVAETSFRDEERKRSLRQKNWKFNFFLKNEKKKKQYFIIRDFFPQNPNFQGVGQIFCTEFFFYTFFFLFFLQFFCQISFDAPKIMFYHFEELKVTSVLPKSRKKWFTCHKLT